MGPVRALGAGCWASSLVSVSYPGRGEGWPSSIVSCPEVQEQSRSFRRLSSGRRRRSGRPGSPGAASRGAPWPRLPDRCSRCQGWGRVGAAAARVQGGASSQLLSCFPRPPPLSLRGQSPKPRKSARKPTPGRASPSARPQAASAQVQAWPPPAGA